ncbi:MAG TPA: hypothetical protein VLL08_30620 [Kineosporiaceae bacterium]|nr:hypothetical protein [Kineosporiaceae bacterium]
MAKKTKGLLAAAMAFAATPQGRMLLQQAKEYASRPETKARAQQLLSQARARRKGGVTPSAPVRDPNSPPYGTPPTP